MGYALTALRAESRITLARRFAAAAGVVVLLALGLIGEGQVADRLGVVALMAFVLAAVSGWAELIVQGRPVEPTGQEATIRGSRAWWLAAIAVVVFAGYAVQTWIKPGSTIAGGDVVVPNGTAWIGRLFQPWTWGGSTLGEPSQLPLALPWATVVTVVHALGGDIGDAQRAWYTALFIGAGLAALGLLAALRLGPLPALIGTAVYLFNPYLITWVNTFDNYLAALVVVAAIPAALVAAGTGRLKPRWSAAIIAATAPLIGYAFLNPPLVGMILAALIAPPLVVAWVEGPAAALRSLRALGLAIPLLLLASAYWTVPAILHLSGGVPSAFTAVSGWTWTEARATIRNALWLNTHWGWNYTEYFPYGGAYNVPPLSFLKFLLPAVAFGALALPQIVSREQRFHRDRQLRLVVAAATVAVVVLAFSTGTNPPGNVIFIPLYNLPSGWLLREPGRFLMLVAVAYSVLTGVLVDALVSQVSIRDVGRRGRVGLGATRLVIAPVALLTALMIGFPVYAGGFVPDTHPTLAPWAISSRQTHVQMPDYWTEMARLTDGLPVQGAVMVLPPDDWYEMPYTWYYGTDAFIPQLFRRRVLVPNSSTYTPAPPQVIGAVNLTADSIQRRDWPQVEALVTALNAPLILVRRDIQEPFPNHSIMAPGSLSNALEAAPNFMLVQRVGSLDLFALRSSLSETEVGAPFTLINTSAPDLRVLSLLPQNTALVTGRPRSGVPSAVEAPQLEGWQAQGTTVVWRPAAPVGWKYRIGDLDSKAVVSLDRAGTYAVGPAKTRIDYSPGAVNNTVTVSVAGRSAVSNGDFAKGVWGAVGDCQDVTPTAAKPNLTAVVIGNAAPGGLPALQLGANLDTACEAQKLAWQGKPFLINLLVHPLQGMPPRLCLWEDGPGRCAAIPALPTREGWSAYRASVTPDPGTTAITLYLYADGGQAGTRTVNEYADVHVVEVPALPSLALLGDPVSVAASPLQLALVHTSFSTRWQGPANSEHVLVDGMLNGWLIQAGTQDFTAEYGPTNATSAADWSSVAGLLLILLLPVWPWIVRLAERRPRGRRQTALATAEQSNGAGREPVSLEGSEPPDQQNEARAPAETEVPR